MNILPVLVTILFSIFSTSVMSYIAMATPIGPWIAPTLVLIGTLIFGVFRSKDTSLGLALTVAGGSIGGILAIACGFSFPTIYFLSPETFKVWMASPLYFIFVMSFLTLAAGSFGFLIGSLLEKNFIVEQEMPFPIGQLIYKMIAVHNQVRKAWELMFGFVATSIFSLLQGGIAGLRSFLPQSIILLKPLSFGPIKFPLVSVQLNVLPMLLAIGFVTGHLIAIPLAVGLLAKIGFMDPLNAVFFSHIKNSDFVLAFCSGMVVVGALQSFLDLPKLIRSFINTVKNGNGMQNNFLKEMRQAVSIMEILLVGIFVISFLTYFRFSFLEQLYLIVGTFICTYQIAMIAGEIGMAQLGRFATFVMVPALFLFGIDPVKLTIIATFVEISGGVATDILFGRKMGYLAAIPRDQLKRYQLLGLLVSTLTVGIVFWLLINRFGLGSENLFAQRAQVRALLINVRGFDLYLLTLGGIFGFLLKKIKMNPMLVLGGILMLPNYSLGLIAGGLLTMFTKKREEWEPFWSGVFAANSSWELIKTLF